METTYANSWSDMAQPCDMDLWDINQYDPTHDLKINVGHRNLYFMVLKTVPCINIIIWDYDSV